MKVLKFIGLILLWILKIIGFILGFILLVILLLLFVPFRYKAEGDFDKGVAVKVHFSWLLYFINGFYEKGEEGDVTLVRIWFIKVYDSRKKSIKDEKKAIKEKKKADKVNRKSDKKRPKSQEALKGPKEYSTRVKEEKLEEPQKEPAKASSKEPLKDDKKEEVTNTNSEDIHTEPAQKPKREEKASESLKEKSQEDKKPDVAPKADRDQKTEKVKKTPKAKKDKKPKKEKTPNPTLVKAKTIWAFLQEPENEGLLKFITKYVVKTLKWILPKEVWLSMEIGLEDPALTGYIAGVTSILYAKTRRHIHVVPNFTDQVIHGSFKVKGRLFLYQPLYYIIRVILSKRVRQLYKLAKG